MSKIDFVKEFRARAHQLRTFAVAGDWMRLSEQLRSEGITLSAADAAHWADLGFLPGEAEPSIRDGITPALTGEMEAYAEEQAGGPEDLTAQRVAQLLDSGLLVREAEPYGGPDGDLRR